jgi:hypothetical protein
LEEIVFIPALERHNEKLNEHRETPWGDSGLGRKVLMRVTVSCQGWLSQTSRGQAEALGPAQPAWRRQWLFPVYLAAQLWLGGVRKHLPCQQPSLSTGHRSHPPGKQTPQRK